MMLSDRNTSLHVGCKRTVHREVVHEGLSSSSHFFRGPLSTVVLRGCCCLMFASFPVLCQRLGSIEVGSFHALRQMCALCLVISLLHIPERVSSGVVEVPMSKILQY